MDLTQLLMSQLGEGGLSAIAGKIGANNDQTANALGGIVPTLLGAMTKNSENKDGANGLLGALDRDHDGSIFDDVAGFVSNSDQGPGNGILKNVLGNNQTAVANGLSKKTGLDTGQVGNLLKIAAPLIMGYLGKQKKEKSNGFDANGIASMLGGLTKTADKSTGIDLGDVLNIVGKLSGGQSQSGGIGGMLGKMFGK